MELTAFELRSDYAGTVAIEDPPGSEPRDVPIYQGGHLTRADGSSFDVRAALDEGNGTIVIRTRDQALQDLLRAYRPLKEAPVPKGAVPIDGWVGRPLEAIRAEAQRRGFVGLRQGKVKLGARLDAYDDALEVGDRALATDILEDRVAVDLGAAEPDPDPETAGNPAGSENAGAAGEGNESGTGGDA